MNDWLLVEYMHHKDSNLSGLLISMYVQVQLWIPMSHVHPQFDFLLHAHLITLVALINLTTSHCHMLLYITLSCPPLDTLLCSCLF